MRKQFINYCKEIKVIMQKNNIGIVIPTYNEKSNIGLLMNSILKLLPNCFILVVDDSTDGTRLLLDKIEKHNHNVKIIYGKDKSGRGAAVLKGIEYFLKNSKIQFIFEMDADFSHDPKELPKMLDAIKTCDVVIGSRYIHGSKIIDWPVNRRMFSRIANFFASLILRIGITDYTNGYRCYKRETLENINLTDIKTKGFFVLSDIAYRIYRKGYIFKELPSVFVNRKRDKSNFNLKEVHEAFFTLLKLRFLN